MRQLVYAGIEINARLISENGSPFLVIEDRPIWLFPEMERFILLYMLTGNNTEIPTYKNRINFKADKDFIYKHIKREIERGGDNYSQDKETQDGIDGIHFVGLYPYGSIDYGFFPCSWEELNTQLDSIEPFIYADLKENDIPTLHYNSLPIEYIDLADGAHLDSIFPDGFIPTNTIIDKTICGCGATWLEIHAKRNSIIIEPNVPVIIGKEQQHKDIIGVYGEDIDVKDIIQRISEQKGYVKLMTTPDSYPKVESALYKLRIPYGLDYFILLDECEKMVSEIDFRPNLMFPIDDFFKFEGKAMVSATPILMSDPRFEQHNFKIIKVVPELDHKRPLELKTTNNVKIAVKRTFDNIDSDAVICFFYNSVEGIEDLIAFLDISDKSNIYCSTEARKKLRRRDYSNVFDSVTDEDGNTKLNKYNFFTSRFYSAVDIKVEFKPIVIMITDVNKKVYEKTIIDPKTGEEKVLYKTPYTIIDPETEAIQIAGRFRNGIERLIHITNTSHAIHYYSKEVLEQNLKGQHDGLHLMTALYESAKDNGEKEIIYNGIRNTEYWRERYVDWRSGEKNFFRYNNAYLDERLKMLYNFPASLYKSYKRSGAFNIVSESEYVIYTDEEKQSLENATLKEKAKILNEILSRDNNFENKHDDPNLEELKQEHIFIVEALSTLGYAKMKALKFKKSAIEAELKRVQFNNKVQSDIVKQAIYETFEEKWYNSSFINENIYRIFSDNGIDCNKIGLSEYLKLYFKAEEKRKNSERGWMIHERLTD